MRQFFAFLKKEMMRVASNVVIGALARDAIQNQYLPIVGNAVKNAKNDAQREKLQELYDDYAEYADVNKKGKEFDKAAASVVRQIVKAFGGSEQDLDDVSQETAMNLLGGGGGARKRSKAWENAVAKFDPLKNTPRKFVSFFMSVISLRTRSVWRDMSEAAKSESHKIKTVPMVDEEGGSIDIRDQYVDLNEFDEAWMRNTMRDMTRYVMGKIKKPWMKEMFKRWMKLAVSKGAGSIKFTRDIVEPMMESGEEGYPNTQGMYRRTWKGIVSLMVDYFENVLPKHGEPPVLLTNKAKNKLLRAAADRVAAAEYRVRFSKWMLGR